MADSPQSLSGPYGPYLLACGSITLRPNVTRLAPAPPDSGLGSILSTLHFRLIWILSGQARFGSGRNAVAVEHGMVLFLDAGMRLATEIRTPMRAIQVLFDAVHGTRSPDARGLPVIGLPRPQPSAREVWGHELPLALPEQHASAARNLIQRIHHHYGLSQGELLRANALLGLWLSGLVLDVDAATGGPEVAQDPVVRVMQEGVRAGGRISDLARRIRCSPDHFRRLVHRRFGCAPRTWLLRRRLDAAAEMLLHSDKTIIELARDFGYANAAAFSRAFSRYIGSSPKAWRRRER